MSMTAETLKVRIKAELAAEGFVSAQVDKIASAIAKAVVAEITTNGIVVTTCAAGAGTGIIT
jgi:hypothetical protein